MTDIKADKTSLSCIKDMPISRTNDRLNADGYAKALCRFIEHADTPITIGIQGGWGSGKSSLFTLMQSILEEKKSALFVEINAWEHSLFADHGSQANVVLSVLRGLIEAITKEMDNPAGYIDKVPKDTLKSLKEGLKSTVQTIGAYLPIFAQLAAFGAAAAPASQNDSPRSEMPRLAEEIHKLKENLNSLVGQVKKNGKPLKTVIFIDDLDRVPPPVAVQILDVIKNVFDIDNCVFVLAIDYDVIVKGLQSKFGERTDKNEREFRQYFDKIIQIPFTMPLGAYSQAMDSLLKDAFQRLDIYDQMEIDDSMIRNITKIAKLSTGGIPRSIKRILNTLSLLQYIEDTTGDTEDNHKKKKYLQIRFIIVSLLINFPEICRRLMEKTNFTSWEIDKLNTPWDLDYYGKLENELKEIAKNRELEQYFNDDWEKIIYCLCSRSGGWLKLKAYNVSKIMNILKNILNNFEERDNGAEDEEFNEDEANSDNLSDAALQALARVLSSISVVSVDMDNANETENIKYDEISKLMKNIHRELLGSGLKDFAAPPDDQLYAVPSDSNNSVRTYTIPVLKGNVKQISLIYRGDLSEFEVAIVADRKGREKDACNRLLKELNIPVPAGWSVPKNIQKASDKDCFKLSFGFDMEDVKFENNKSLPGDIAGLYKFADSMSAKLD